MMEIPGIIALREEDHMWPASANAYLLPDSDGATILDVGCGKKGRYLDLKAFISSAGLTPADIHTVILSHAHPDHMGAMKLLLQEADPEIIIHRIEKPLAKAPDKLNETFDMDLSSMYYRAELERLWGIERIDIVEYFRGLCPIESIEVTETVEEGDVIRAGEFEFEVIHTPGHAPGQISLYDERKGILFSGDLVGAVVAWYSPSGGGASGYLSSLEKMEKRSPSVLLPSHGDYITEVGDAIEVVRKKLLGREEQILELLSKEALSVRELNDALFKNEIVRLYPGIQITESHLIKLEVEGRITRSTEEGIPYVTLRN